MTRYTRNGGNNLVLESRSDARATLLFSIKSNGINFYRSLPCARTNERNSYSNIISKRRWYFVIRDYPAIVFLCSRAIGLGDKARRVGANYACIVARASITLDYLHLPDFFFIFTPRVVYAQLNKRVYNIRQRLSYLQRV